MPLASLESISAVYGLNHYLIDTPYKALLRYYLGREPNLAQLGEYARGV